MLNGSDRRRMPTTYQDIRPLYHRTAKSGLAIIVIVLNVNYSGRTYITPEVVVNVRCLRF